MIREPKRRTIVVYLPEIGAFPEDSIRPGRYSRFFAVISMSKCLGSWSTYLRAIIFVTSKVVLVSRIKSNPRLRVVRESKTSYHLQIQLWCVRHCSRYLDIQRTYLIVFIQVLQVTGLYELSHSLCAKSDTIIEIADPDHTVCGNDLVI
jgi:hypothetical protein